MVAHLLNVSRASLAAADQAPAGHVDVRPNIRSRTAASPLRLECLPGPAGLERLAPVWNTVVERAALTHPFATHEWMRAWCATQIDPARLRCFVVRAGDDVVAIAPLVERRGPTGLTLTRSGVSCAHTPRLDLIVADRHEESYRLLWQAIAPRGWTESLELQDLDVNGPTFPAIKRLARRDGLLVGCHPTLDAPYIDLAGTWDEYYRALHPERRDTLSRRLRRLSRLGDVRLETVRDRAALPEALDRAFQLEAAAWKYSAGTAILCRPELVRFYTEMAHGMAARGWLRLQFLTVRGERIAFLLGLEYGNRLYSLKTGYDPAYSSYSPGQQLFQLAIRDAFERGLDAVDLLGARTAWKLHWTARSAQHYRVTVLPRTVAGRLAHAIRFRMIPGIRRSHLYREYRARYRQPESRRAAGVRGRPERS